MSGVGDPVADPGHTDRTDGPTVTVYWRPGCPYCGLLRRGLKKAGLATVEIDIWSDPAGAAFVRTQAAGNETVPTVAVGGTVLVNPSVGRVMALAADAGIVAAPRRRWFRTARV